MTCASIIFILYAIDLIIKSEHDVEDGETSMDGVVTDIIDLVYIQERCDNTIPEGKKHEHKSVEGDTIEKKSKLNHKQWRRYLKTMRRKDARQKVAQERERKEKEHQRGVNDCTKIQVEAEAKLREQIENENEIEREKEHQHWLQREKDALEHIKRAESVTEVVGVGGILQEDGVNESREVEKVAGGKKDLLQKELMKLEQQKVQPVFHNPERPGPVRSANARVESQEVILTQTEVNDNYQSLLRDKNNCSFFMKTGACKFGPRCSRGHVACNNSPTILIPNFFQDAGLEIPMINETSNDAGIEYDELEMNHKFETFYEDVIDEFKSAGDVVMFKCCQNYAPHLRGNVYVQFAMHEHAMEALKMFNGRFYAGRQLSVQLSPVSNWKSAICGLFLKHSCTHGRLCNFLHVFRNPGNSYTNFDTGTISERIKKENKWTLLQSESRRRGSSHRSHSPSHSRSPRQSHSRSRTRRHSRSRSRSPGRRYKRDRRRSHSRDRSRRSLKSRHRK